MDRGEVLVLPKIDGRDVLERARTGDAAAFEELVRLHERRVLSQALRLTGQLEDAQDVSQEAFVRLYRNLSRMRDAESIGAWLRRIVANLCCDEARRRKTSLHVAVAEVPDAGHVHTPEVEAMGHERERVLQSALQELGARERAALVLRELEGLSTEEVAETLGSAPATVRAQIFQARLKLARILKRLQGGSR